MQEGKTWKEVHELKKPVKSNQIVNKELPEKPDKMSEKKQKSTIWVSPNLTQKSGEKEAIKMEINGDDSDDEIRVIGCVSKNEVN